MIKFQIPPEYCLILNAFSQATTLRGAAKLLQMDPPALVRKVKKISDEYGYLQKAGSRWVLTESGIKIAQWTDEFINSQFVVAQQKSQTRLAAYTWLAEELLIPHIHLLDTKAHINPSWSIKIIANDLEQELIHSRSDFVIHGLAPNDPTIAYKRIATFAWKVVVPFKWRKKISNLNENQMLDFLHSNSFIPHSKMNPEQVLGFKPTKLANISIDGVIGLRSAVINNLGWSVLPAMSIVSALHEEKIIALNIITHLKDDVSIWWLRSRKDLLETSKILTKWLMKISV